MPLTHPTSLKGENMKESKIENFWDKRNKFRCAKNLVFWHLIISQEVKL